VGVILNWRIITKVVSNGGRMMMCPIKIKCLVLAWNMMIITSSMCSMCIAEEYGSNTVLQANWGRPAPTAHQKALGAPPLTKAEEIVLGYIPEEKEPDPEGHREPAYGPRDFDVDKEGNIYITDILKQRVVKFDKQGRYVLSFGKKGNIVHLSRPINIAIDGQGNAYVKDLDNDRCIFRFDSSGNLLEKITSIGSYSSGQIKWFSALESDERGHVFIRAKVGEKNM
jgi:hypothetical protein